MSLCNAFACGLVVSCVLLVTPAPIYAHPVPFSFLDLRLPLEAGTDIDGSLVVHIFDAAHDLNIDPPERLLEPAFVDQHAAAIVSLLIPRLRLNADGRTVQGEWSGVEILPERQSLHVQVRYRLDHGPGVLTVTTAMFPYDPVHQTFLNIYEGDGLTQAILDRTRGQFEYFAGGWRGALAVMRKLIPAGINYILIPEHLLFVVGLLLLGGRVRWLAVIVTAFAVAHSVTLALAALNFVAPPARIVGPAIALSIVYVGLDNLMVQSGRDLRLWMACAFGLVHGFSFANVLRGMDLPARALGWSLFSFDLGVEIGQLLVVAAVVSLLAALSARGESAGRLP